MSGLLNIKISRISGYVKMINKKPVLIKIIVMLYFEIMRMLNKFVKKIIYRLINTKLVNKIK